MAGFRPWTLHKWLAFLEQRITKGQTEGKLYWRLRFADIDAIEADFKERQLSFARFLTGKRIYATGLIRDDESLASGTAVVEDALPASDPMALFSLLIWTVDNRGQTATRPVTLHVLSSTAIFTYEL